MLRLSPTDWRTQVKIFEKFGCLYVRQKGTHLIYHHPDANSITISGAVRKAHHSRQFKKSHSRDRKSGRRGWMKIQNLIR